MQQLITKRKIGQVTASSNEPKPGEQANNECDTNADTCCLGKNWVVLAYTQRAADVYSYDTSSKPIEGVPIVTGATAWTDPNTGDTYILVINEALYYGTKLDHSLINPNQIRHYGIGFWDNPYDKQRGLFIDVNDSVQIPMKTEGTKIFYQTRSPTEKELNECPKIVMTSKTEWNPGKISMSEVITSKPWNITSFRISQTISVPNKTTFEYDTPVNKGPINGVFAGFFRDSTMSLGRVLLMNACTSSNIITMAWWLRCGNSWACIVIVHFRIVRR